MTRTIYKARPIKRRRRTNAELEQLDAQILQVLEIPDAREQVHRSFLRRVMNEAAS